MLTITKEQFDAIAHRVNTHPTCHGIGTMKKSCTVAHMQIAMSGEVTDKRPDCMSAIIHAWVIPMQDSIPVERLNNPRWQRLIPFAAGTGNNHETERLSIIMDWMWGTVLTQLQPLADENGFGAEWRHMTTARTKAAAEAAAAAAAAAVPASSSAAPSRRTSPWSPPARPDQLRV